MSLLLIPQQYNLSWEVRSEVKWEVKCAAGDCRCWDIKRVYKDNRCSPTKLVYKDKIGRNLALLGSVWSHRNLMGWKKKANHRYHIMHKRNISYSQKNNSVYLVTVPLLCIQLQSVLLPFKGHHKSTDFTTVI